MFRPWRKKSAENIIVPPGINHRTTGATMSKRFTETAKWADPWFRKLKLKHKALWIFLCDNCDLAGIWKADLQLAGYYIGARLHEAEILQALGDRVRTISDGKVWHLVD